MKSPFTTLFIDFDNTIISYEKAEEKALNKMGALYGIKPSIIPKMITQYKLKNEELWSCFERKEIDIPTIKFKRFSYMQGLYPQFKKSHPDQLNMEYLDYFVQSTDIDEDDLNLLILLKDSGYRIIIVSNGIHDIQTKRISRLGLLDIIDDYVTSEEAGAPKPAINMFELAHRKIETISGSSIDKAEILMIGDSYNADIVGSENYGIASCWVSMGRKDFKHDFTINSFKDIKKYLI